MGFSNMMMAAAKSMPKSTITQSMPSLTYSSCSTTNMWWLKNCWSFSFTKLMEICSKPLYSKISKPAMSRTAQKLAFFMVGSISVSLHLMMSHLKRRSKEAVAIPFLLVGESNDVKGSICHLQLFIVINRGDSDLTLGNIDVVIDIISQETFRLHGRNMRLQQLVEDVVGPLNRLLLGNTGLFQQVGLNVTTAKLTSRSKVNLDEFTEPGGVVVPGGLGITIRLQDGVGGYNLVFKGSLLFLTRLFLGSGNSSQV